MALKVGITGGIGSGKSTICRIFEVLGVPVYDADSQTKVLMQTYPPLVTAIKEAFGEEAYLENGELNRAFLSNKVFKDASQLARLNAIVHPLAIQAAIDWALAQDAPYTLKEAALLFESGSYQHNDYNILVVADEEIRIQRVMERDGITREQVLDRISKQLPDEEKRKMADFIIDNSGTHPVLPQVLALHEKFLTLAK